MATPELRPLTPADFTALAELAGAIWRAHYTPLIGAAQIEYMLAGRFTPENLNRYIHSAERWLELLSVDGRLAGYCSYSLTDKPATLKLEQLYVLPELHGQGLGGIMLRHIETRARELGRARLMLTVAKRNANSIAFYRKNGFLLTEEAVFDIGQGYVMDDYVMEKELAA